MNIIFKNKKHGFSLIETLVYIAVLILVMSVGVTSFLALDDVLLRSVTERTLVRSAETTLERMVRDIRAGTTVNVGASTLGSSPGVLVLNAGATTTTFSISGGNVVLDVNGTILGPLTSDAVAVSNLVFDHYNGSTTEFVRVTLTLGVSSKSSTSTKTFYTSAVLRGSYE